MKQKHAELIKAWADGAEIEVKWKNTSSDWYPQEDFLWFIRSEFADKADFRIKPKPKPDVVQTCEVSISFASFTSRYPTVQFTFDGETGKLKSAEVLK